MPTALIASLFSLALMPAMVAQTEEPLRLQEAVAMGLERNPQHKIALAEIRMAAADFKEARSFYLPRIDFSETATRSNDPVYVFGTRLRQSRFTSADFSLNQLNHPGPIGDFSTRFGGQWTLFDSFTTTFNVRRAHQLKAAASERLVRSDQIIVFRIIQAYYAALLAQQQKELAEHASLTAEAVLDQSRARVEAGTAVESDLLTAQVDFAARQQELVRARNAVEMAGAELAIAMGAPADRKYRLSDELKEVSWTETSLPEIESLALKQRSDLKEVGARVKASDDGVRAARSAFGPRITAFADSELDNVSPFANGSNNWTAGAELRIDLFSGGQKSASLSRARADLERNEAQKQSAEDAVRLEVRRAYYELESARRTLEVSKAAVSQSEESLRIIKNRYGAGMTTMTDLLRAEDAARLARTNYWEAVFHGQVGYAALKLASGEISADSMNSLIPVVAP